MSHTSVLRLFKKKQFKTSLILFGFLIMSSAVSGQFADLGNGKYKNSIWWINWSGYNFQNNTTRIVFTNTGLQISFHFSNVSGDAPFASSMKTWVGSILPIMYDFSNPGIKPAILTPTTTQNTNFTITVEGFRNGIPVPVSLIIADAEASSSKEQIKTTTSGSNFKTIEFYRNSFQTSNPFIGCNTTSGYFTQTQDESVWPDTKGQCPIVLTQSDGTPLKLDVSLERSVYGASAIAFGVLEAGDRGDLPSSYGYSYHYISYNSTNSCNFNPPYPTLIQNEDVYLGSAAGDADPTENSNDNAVGIDENAIATFPDFVNDGIYNLSIPLKNVSGKSAYLSGWFDYNQDGIFQNSEKASATIPTNAVNALLSWKNLPVLPVTGTNFAFRFRISTDLAASDGPTGFAPDGEVEDYYIPLNIPKKDTIIINDYTEVLQYVACRNELSVADAAKYSAGDTVLLIQMKGAGIDSTNTPNFGNITNYNSAGNYELNIIKAKSGNVLTLLNTLKRTYDIPAGKVQLVRVPYFQNLDTAAVITCLPWDGSKGGVVVLNVKNTLNLQEDIDASGRGFRHGNPMKNSFAEYNQQDYYYNQAANKGAQKGEGIAFISDEKNYGRGAPANGGGGGNAHNSGGGGGANGGNGGHGGDQWSTGKTITENVGGKGGHALSNSAAMNKLFMGGAGGMGHANDFDEFPAGNGGGIIIINAGNLKANSHSIKANGGDATEAPNLNGWKDGMAGGGGGGSVNLMISNTADVVVVEAKGGKGADQVTQQIADVGPGGGGGGGVIMFPQAGSYFYTLDVIGGKNGVNLYHNNNPYGATAGGQGLAFNSFNGNFDLGQPFVPTVQKIDFTDTIKACTALDVKAPSHADGSPITNWAWDMGDGNSNTSQYFIHDYNKYGTFTVTLTATDIDGCIATGSKTIDIKLFTISPIRDTSICRNDSVQLNVVGGTKYKWIPALGLSDSSIANPIAYPSVSTHYLVVAGNDAGCITAAGFDLVVNELPEISVSGNASVCRSDSAQLIASGAVSYEWSGGGYISNTNGAAPIVFSDNPATYFVKGIDANGCSDTSSFSITQYPEPMITITADTSVCENNSIQLAVSGGSSYQWYPAASLTNANSATPIASPFANTIYHVDIIDQYNCAYLDSVEVNVFQRPVFSVSPDTSVCLKQPVTLHAYGGDDYTWGQGVQIEQHGKSDFLTQPDTSTNYWVVVHHEACNLDDTLRTQINVMELPEIIASSSNDIGCLVNSSQLTASGGNEYIWSPAAGLNNHKIPNPIASPTVTTQYMVTTKGPNGCTNSDTVSVIVNYLGKSFSGLPNAFTPNGDGLNDCLSLKSFGPVTELDFRIYNRFGHLIFQTNNPADCWDGTYRGQPQDADVFVYTIKAKSACAEINQKGTVTLIR